MKRVVTSILLSIGILLSVLVSSPESASAAGMCLVNKTGLTEFDGLTNTDLLARLIFAEAQGESWIGKKGVAHVVNNRVEKNLTKFGGGTIKGVILKEGEFEGMKSIYARCPGTDTDGWKESLSVAQNIGANPVGDTLWFNRNDIYDQNSDYLPALMADAYTFDGETYHEVVEKTIIGNHTFFRVYPY
ncbi:hypothetical protein UACE39S_04335 [Ureibacillus acetophenoni]